MAERLLYLPSVGFCLLVAVALRAAASRAGRRSRTCFAAAIGVLAALHGGRAALRSADWVSQERLYLVDLARSPESARVQSNAGFIFQGRGDHERALRHFSRALEIEPRYETAYVNAGVSLAALGQHGRAIRVFRRAVELKPWVASLHGKLAEELLAVGDAAGALPHLEEAARLAPENAEMQRALARAYEAAGHPEWAQAIYDRGVSGAVVRRRGVD
jgi:tetratricopeptide (TPR) repeat protein